LIIDSISSTLDPKEIEKYDGNMSCYTIKPNNSCEINILPVYSPARPIDTSTISEKEINSIKLNGNNRLWLTEIIWSGLQNIDIKTTPWIIAWDYNSSETFDKKWQKENGVTASFSVSGNKEILDRMENLWFTECLRWYNGKIIPTFKHSRGKIMHQIDHMFVNKQLSPLLKHCSVGDETQIFGQKISDHLPIIADFENSNIPSKKIEDFINNNKRTFAKTYADFAPHEYIVKRTIAPDQWDNMDEYVTFIQQNWYPEDFYGKTFTYYHIWEYKYRVDQWYQKDTYVLNRVYINNDKKIIDNNKL